MGKARAVIAPKSDEQSKSYHHCHEETINPRGERKKSVLFVTSELAELVKVGGLGEVSSALPKALCLYHDIRILIPGYQQVINSKYSLDIIGKLDGYAGIPSCKIGVIDIDGLIVYVIVCPELYEREGTPYSDALNNDWPDNHIRFALLEFAAAEIALGSARLGWRPDLVHANDWPSGLAPAYIAWRGQSTPTVFTIHNLAYQGLFNRDCSADLGLPPEAFTMESMEFYGKLSFLKAGIGYATHVTTVATVSETYAREITMPELGCGLDGLLRYKYDLGLLSGITNGIDDSWEPSSDPHLVEGFESRQLEGKKANTRYIEEMFGLRSSGAPLFAVVSRLVQQKGLDLTVGIARKLVKAGGRLAIMGGGEPALEAELLELAESFPETIGVYIGFNEADARRLFAGSDFLLMPSRFEPCGLSQMYAQSFGSLPIARETGGLVDTIEDGLNGFLFKDATVESYFKAIKRALHVFKYPNLLNAMRRHAMASPLFWEQSVEPYDRLLPPLAG